MAHRSYLYSTNAIPGKRVSKNERQLVGISEWNYGIPLVYKLLLSGNPRACRSSIWDLSDDIAVVGDYKGGVANLREFLGRLNMPGAQPLIDEALDFLGRPENQNAYFLLEPGEIFDMDPEPVPDLTARLVGEIKNLEGEKKAALRSLLAQPETQRTLKPFGLFAKLLGNKPAHSQSAVDPIAPVYALGLGNWSNVLYFDFSEA